MIFITISCIIIIGLLVIFYLYKNREISLGPPITQKDYCKDNDAITPKTTLLTQSLRTSFVIYLHNECDSPLDIGGESGCGFFLTSHDNCKNKNILLEQTCNGDYLLTKEISCPKGCLQGKCLK